MTCTHDGSIVSVGGIARLTSPKTMRRTIKPDTLWRCDQCKGEFRADALPAEWVSMKHLQPQDREGPVFYR